MSPLLLQLPPPDVLVIVVVNAVLCLGIAWASVCRLTNMSRRTTRPAFRYLYAATVGAAVAAAVAWPWLYVWPHLALLASYLGNLALNARAWGRGPPAVARKTATAIAAHRAVHGPRAR